MPSNNYAEVITDSTEAQRVLAELESMAAQGSRFIVRQFNPEVDRFEVACWRESNYPTLIDVEAGGETMDGAAVAALWNANADTLASIDFGNGYIGLYYESEGRSHIAIPDREQWLGRCRNSECRCCCIPMKVHEEWLAHCIRREHDVCAKEFGFTCALDFYLTVVAAAEETGEGVVFTATCPVCKAEPTDPFLQLMNKVRARINERP